eukprot:gene55792-76471_t
MAHRILGQPSLSLSPTSLSPTPPVNDIVDHQTEQ